MDEGLKARLLKPRIEEAEVELPGLGTLRVRGMTRLEALQVGELAEEGLAAQERLILHLCLVDPAVTEDEAEAIQEVSPGAELEPLFGKIRELSGDAEGQAKDTYRKFRGGPKRRV